ncbi:asparagine synthetase B family protein [Methylacidimicrobium tartarophylax]|uniref:asparagine synthase (glutamine-hydrolyzing) n=1 Tax=Methylacidimicrobium tartarophylax TaxID=1041768 RepID=A0A5E6MBM9_9BACT|nr:asparagine synthase-related protein [Methylacidimicrobium tartarophylax]VVM05719.1 asparagine synthase (glutamine-hydrolysing) [Methylacidimicrobium tartarophylax]
MAGIAGIIRWDSEPAPPDGIEGMLETIRHRGPDGLYAETRKNVALGHARFLLHERERNKTQPVWLPDGSMGLTADARLYNRAELVRVLGAVPWFREIPSNAELLLAAFERWGEECVTRLRGDFAFAVWDETRERLFAARDPFGVKPFFYQANSRGIAFGSEPKQLLRLPGVGSEPNDGVIVDYLVYGSHRAFEETFFRDVRRLRAGHTLLALRNGVSQRRFWPASVPPEDFRGSPQECAEAFSILFRESVHRRLEMDARAAVHLSGGYDSSAVAVAAATTSSPRSPKQRPLTVSLLYPGLACDESLYSQAVAAQTGLEHLECIAPLEDPSSGLLDEIRKVDCPISDIRWQQWEALASLMRGRGCKVVLTGLGGDELVLDPDYEFDLCRSHQFLSALWYCWSDPRVLWTKARKFRLICLLRRSVPQEIKRLLRRGDPRPPIPIPDWVNPALVEEHRSYLERTASHPNEPTFPDLARETIARWHIDPAALWVLELEECSCSYAGFESRHPFYDQDLVAFVLSIPFRTRLQLPAVFKTLLTTALGDSLPAVVRKRGSKVHFDYYALELLGKAWPGLSCALSDPARLASGRYIVWEQAARHWSRPISDELAWFTSARPFWQLADLEIWLRSLHHCCNR